MRLPFALCFVPFFLACGSSEPSAGSETDPASNTPAPSGSSSSSPSAETKPAVCVAPPSGKPSVVTATGAIQVPAVISGSTKEAIEFQRFTFELDRVLKIRVKASSSDFKDATERTGVGFSINYLTSQNSEDGRVTAQVSPSKPSDDKTTGWLLPGRYDLLVSRSTSASANANAPILPHAYTVTLDTIEAPQIVGACTFPDDARSPTDVRAFPECGVWCKKVVGCGMDCRDEECAIPKGQCEASIRKALECKLAAGFSCVTQGGGHGYSIDAECKPDASICKP